MKAYTVSTNHATPPKLPSTTNSTSFALLSASWGDQLPPSLPISQESEPQDPHGLLLARLLNQHLHPTDKAILTWAARDATEARFKVQLGHAGAARAAGVSLNTIGRHISKLSCVKKIRHEGKATAALYQIDLSWLFKDEPVAEKAVTAPVGTRPLNPSGLSPGAATAFLPLDALTGPPVSSPSLCPNCRAAQNGSDEQTFNAAQADSDAQTGRLKGGTGENGVPNDEELIIQEDMPISTAEPEMDPTDHSSAQENGVPWLQEYEIKYPPVMVPQPDSLARAVAPEENSQESILQDSSLFSPSGKEREKENISSSAIAVPEPPPAGVHPEPHYPTPACHPFAETAPCEHVLIVCARLNNALKTSRRPLTFAPHANLNWFAHTYDVDDAVRLAQYYDRERHQPAFIIAGGFCHTAVARYLGAARALNLASHSPKGDRMKTDDEIRQERQEGRRRAQAQRNAEHAKEIAACPHGQFQQTGPQRWTCRGCWGEFSPEQVTQCNDPTT